MNVVSKKRRPEGSHFIKNTTHRPNVAFAIVRQVSPNFRAGIIRSASLGASKTTLTDLANIQISQLDLFVILAQQQIGTLDISMKDVHPMQCLQPM